MRYTQLSSIILALSLISSADAKDDFGTDLMSDMLFAEDVPVVLTASRLRQPITEAPTAMTTIDRQQIERSGIRTIPELFRMVPGMMVGYPKGSKPLVTYHGMSDQFSRRMQILIDGRAVYLPDLGRPDWNSLPLNIDDIERIEITRGSNAATYGSNSFMGVINIVTRHSSDTVGGFVRHDNGTQDVESSMVRYGDNFGKFDMRVSVAEGKSNYFQRITRSDAHYQETKRINFRGDLQMAPDSQLRFEAGYNDDVKNDYQMGNLVQSHTDREFHQVKWTETYSTDSEVSLQAYYSRHHYNIVFPKRFVSGQPIVLTMEDDIRNERYDIEGQYTFAFTTKLRGVIGASIRQDKLRSPYGFNTEETQDIEIKRLFGTLELRITNDWLAQLGLMVEDHDLMGTKSSPRISTNYHIDDANHLRLSVSQAYRAPLMFEHHPNRGMDYLTFRNYEFINPPGEEIEPERITTYDIGYIFKESRSPLMVDLRLFREKLDKLITPIVWWPVAANDPDLYALGFANRSNATIDGSELAIKYDEKSWSGQLTYSYIDIDHEHYGGIYQGDPDPLVCCSTYYDYDHSAPMHKASLMLEKRLQSGLFFSGAYHYADTYHWLGNGDPMPRYDRLDLSFGADIQIDNHPASLRFVLENVLTGDNLEYLDTNVLDKRAYIVITLEHI